MYVVVIIFN